MSYIDPVHMFIFLGPRLKEQSLPGDLMMKDSIVQEAKPNHIFDLDLNSLLGCGIYHITFH